jgi:glutamine amidotransferase
MKKVAIIDYGCGNILNLVRAVKYLGYKVEVTNEKKKIISSSNVIFPGVGSFGNAVKKLKKYDLKNIITEYVSLNKPFLGICLGMQLLLSQSEEFGIHKGLNIIEGKNVKISNKNNSKIKIPHVGWNDIYPTKNKKSWNNKILANIPIGTNFYFVHSFIALTKNEQVTNAVCNYYETSIPAVVSIENIFGCQFHPEKSGENGLNVLKNFLNI